MNRTKLKALCSVYETRIQKYYADNASERDTVSYWNRAQHIQQMLLKIPNLPVGKANRWLGFVQGWFWEREIYTIDEMRDHNRHLNESKRRTARPLRNHR